MRSMSNPVSEERSQVPNSMSISVPLTTTSSFKQNAVTKLLGLYVPKVFLFVPVKLLLGDFSFLILE